MDRRRCPWLGLGLMVCAVLAALAGGQHAVRPPVAAESPVATPVPLETAPSLPPARTASDGPSFSWTNAWVALLWVVIGLVLGLGIIVSTHYWYRRRLR